VTRDVVAASSWGSKFTSRRNFLFPSENVWGPFFSRSLKISQYFFHNSPLKNSDEVFLISTKFQNLCFGNERAKISFVWNLFPQFLDDTFFSHLHLHVQWLYTCKLLFYTAKIITTIAEFTFCSCNFHFTTAENWHNCALKYGLTIVTHNPLANGREQIGATFCSGQFGAKYKLYIL